VDAVVSKKADEAGGRKVSLLLGELVRQVE
jgi:hypothetical protein